MARDSREAAAIRLAELSHEIAELESISASILKRLELVREESQATAQRLTAASATIELLCEHVSEISSALDEVGQVEEEVRDVTETVSDKDFEASQLLFESRSLRASLEEIEDEAERLTQLLDGRSRRPRGH
jgi:methyl-accepting chemotaxis protein